MAEKLKKGDFVEIDYEGYTKEENQLFDTTDLKVAVQHGIHSDQSRYGPAIICIGMNQLLGGIDETLIDSTVGSEKTIDLPSEKAFGKKDASELKIVPMNIFEKEKVKPTPGLQVQIDGMYGIIKTVSAGRVIVDFNHPLAGKDVHYKIKIRRIVTDASEKIQSIAAFEMNIPKMFIKVSETSPKTFTMAVPFKMPPDIGARLEEIMKKNLANIDKINYVEEKLKMPEHAHNHGDKDAHGRDKGHEHYGHNHG